MAEMKQYSWSPFHCDEILKTTSERASFCLFICLFDCLIVFCFCCASSRYFSARTISGQAYQGLESRGIIFRALKLITAWFYLLRLNVAALQAYQGPGESHCVAQSRKAGVSRVCTALLEMRVS